MRRLRCLPLLFIALVALPVQPAAPDALVVTRAMTASTIAQFYIAEGSVRVELEIGIADIEAFANILPDDLFELVTKTKAPLDERARRRTRFDPVAPACSTL